MGRAHDDGGGGFGGGREPPRQRALQNLWTFLCGLAGVQLRHSDEIAALDERARRLERRLAGIAPDPEEPARDA
jgi:hypothetical protein